jgi:GntR family transcriptional regulator/MocR family aminotransferase
LQALDGGGRVLYIGSFSKVLFPGTRLGYLVAPTDLADVFASARRFVDVHPPILLQAALSDFMEEGHFGRHLRRMRVSYRERGEAMKEAFDRYLKGAITMAQPQTGMHVVGWLPDDMNDQLVSGAAALEGIEARPLSFYGLGTVKAGLVLGFGTVSLKEITEGARTLARALEAVQRKNRRR